jgi:type IV secretory pathway TrbD component
MTAPLHRLHNCIATAAVTVAVTIMMTHAAHAAGSSMPWEAPLQRILDSVEGPVAKIVAVIIIVVTGLHARLRRLVRRLPPADPDRFRPLDCLRGVELLPVVFLLRRRGPPLMQASEPIAGFHAPVHRALTEPIMLGGAPRAVAIANGTLAAAISLGLRLWLVGLAMWAVGHFAAVWAAKRDAQFVDVVRRHLRYPSFFRV